VFLKLSKKEEPLLHVNKAKEEQRQTHGGPKGSKRASKARVQDIGEAIAVA